MKNDMPLHRYVTPASMQNPTATLTNVRTSIKKGIPTPPITPASQERKNDTIQKISKTLQKDPAMQRMLEKMAIYHALYLTWPSKKSKD